MNPNKSKYFHSLFFFFLFMGAYKGFWLLMVMGYYSTINPEFSIKKELVPAFRAKLLQLYQEANESEKPSREALVIQNLLEDNLYVDDNGGIEFAQYYAKWAEDELLARFLASFAAEGILEFNGEDDSRWGYQFHKGRVYELKYYTKRGRCLN